jgi:hypothetical protein
MVCPIMKVSYAGEERKSKNGICLKSGVVRRVLSSRQVIEGEGGIGPTPVSNLCISFTASGI